jgi:RHS repeat-associated protein
MRTPVGQKTALWGSKKHIIVYAGQYYDAETGLHYNYHRYYDPSLGRYLRADPAGIMKGLNHLYAYVQNNPVNYIDPTGEFLISGSVAVGYAGYVAGTAIAAGIVYYGAPIAADIGTWLGNKLFNESDNDSGEDTRARPPTGSRPIDQTPWSGDHQGIKGEVGAGPADNVVISPDGHVWVENPDGSFTDHGPASDYTNSGKPSGRRGKDRKCRR